MLIIVLFNSRTLLVLVFITSMSSHLVNQSYTQLYQIYKIYMYGFTLSHGFDS